MQISDANLAGLYRGYRVLFNDAFQGTPVMSDPIVMEVPSGHDTEIYDWLGSMPGMRKLNGEIVLKNLAAITWAVTNDEFEDTISIKESKIENDSYGIYNPMMSALGTTAKQHQDVLAFGLLPGGFTANDYTGSPFFSTGKKREPKDAGFSNLLTSPLNAFAYTAARANLRGRRNSEGLPMNLGRKVYLVCGINNETVANTILKSETVVQAVAGTAAGTSVGGSIRNVNMGTAEVLATPFIDASPYPNSWYLIETGLPFKPLIWQVNKPVALYSLTSMESDHVFKKHEFLYQAYGRYQAAYLMPELAVGSTGAGSALTQFP